MVTLEIKKPLRSERPQRFLSEIFYLIKDFRRVLIPIVIGTQRSKQTFGFFLTSFTTENFYPNKDLRGLANFKGLI